MKTIIKLCLIIVIIFNGACSDNPAVRIRYQLEKEYHQAEKQLEEARSFQQVLKPEQLEQLIPIFSKLVDNCFLAFDSVNIETSPVEFKELNYLTYQAVSRLSQLYFADKKYDHSVELYKRLLESGNLSLENEMMTRINLGQTYQTSGNWPMALEVYNQCLEMYYPPLLKSGDIIFPVFNIPSNIFRQYLNQGDRANAQSEFNRAETYYLGFTEKFPDTKLDIAARANLARLYDESGQWNKAIEQLSHLEDTSMVSYGQVLLKKGEIYAEKLKDFDKAIETYQRIFDIIPSEDTLTPPVVYYHIATVKLSQGEFDEVRRILNEIKKKYPYAYNASPRFIFTYARSFELGNKWQRAETEYNLLIEKYRGSEEAMTALLYINDYYRKRNRQIEHEKNFNRALEYYLQVASVNRGNPYEASGLIFAADLFARDEKWDKSVSYLLEIYDKFKDSEIGHKALAKAITIYRNKLDDPEKADSLSTIYNMSKNPIENNDEIKDLLK